MNILLQINVINNNLTNQIMKAKSLLRYAKKMPAFIVVFLWTVFSANAQCPIISDPTPPPICDASGFTFNDLNTYATDAGNGIVWYNSASGGSAYNASELVLEGTYYAGDNSGTCGVRSSIVVDFQVDPSGQVLDRIYCSNDNATIQDYINDVLQSSIPSGGSVQVYNDFNLTNLANPTDVIPIGASNYYIVFVDNGGCESQQEIGQVGVFAAPMNPTPPTPQDFCIDSNPTVGDLNPGTAATNYNWYANLDGSGDPILPALPLSTPLTDGNTYYVQVDDVFCVSNPVAVIVNVDDPVDPGTPGIREFCNNNIPASNFDLFDYLNGTPENTGTWTGPITTSNGHLGTVNISALTTPGDYIFTYTVADGGFCPDQTATVTITIYETFTSGTAVAGTPICEVDLPAAFDLFTLLENEDPNGQWTQGTLSTDPIVNSPIDLTGFAPGIYSFTYTQNLAPNPCPEESTTVQVEVLQDPEAGTPTNPSAFCENDLAASSLFDLFGQLSGNDAGGTWSDDDLTGALTGSDVDLTLLTIGSYDFTYSVTVANGCTDDALVTITVVEAPESGTVNGSAPFCEGSAPSSFDLFGLLDNEDQTGTWYIGTDNLGATTANPVDLSGLTNGTYSFTYDVDAIGSCDDVLVTVDVIINPLPNTGTANNPLPFCENDPALTNTSFDLFSILNAPFDGGGTWSDDDSTGALVTANEINLSILGIGVYNFTYSITDANGCTNSTTVTITIVEAPESGTVNGSAPFCEGSAPSSFDLFGLLDNEDQTGTWYIGTDNLGATTANPVDLSGLTNGTYSFTYDVDAIGSCDDVLVTVDVIINPLPNTGTANNPLPFCENDPALTNTSFDLFSILNAPFDGGGTWSDDDGTGTLVTANEINLSILGIGVYNFTYSITDANGCTNSTTVTITIVPAPESGTPVAGIPEFCAAEITVAQSIDLFDLLEGEDQSGVWNDDSLSGMLTGNTVTIDGLGAGTYNFTYNVNAIGSCDDVDVTVSITINDTAAPTALTPQDFCDSATVSDLVATGTNIQWYDEATGGTALTGTTSLVDGETYYATQTDATTSCESSVRFEVIAEIYQSPNPGNPSATGISACNNDNSIDLNAGLDGTQDTGGVWQDTDGTGALSANILDATGLAAGDYQFTYVVAAISPCIDDSTTITVRIDTPLDAGTDGTLDDCSNNGTTDLFTRLGGSPDTGGTWSPALTSGTGVFDPLVDVEGTYTYTLTNACGTSTSEVVVSITQAPYAGADDSVSICVIDGVTDLFPLLGSGAQSGGTWSPALASGTANFDPGVDAPGVYTYTVLATGFCTVDSSAQITVTVNDSPVPTVIDSNPAFCSIDHPIVSDLDSALTITGTVIWYEDAALTTVANATDALIDGEDYYASQTNSSGCESSTSTSAITVTINDAPTPTLIDSNQELCINDGPTIAELTSNISESNSTQFSVVWYDLETGGSAISNSTILNNGTTYYAALIDVSTGCESSVRLAITPDLTSCGKLIIPDGFSPNGDGVNDTFNVDNLEILYPNFVIEIYNRYGNMVYKGSANSPRFNGKSNQSGTLGDGDLPVGVYFYIFNFNDGVNKPEEGRLYLSR